MTMHCDSCRRDFGGTDAYERHLVRRQDRCKNAREMQRSRLVFTEGVWHRPPINPQPTLFDRRRVPQRRRKSGGVRA